MEIVFPGRGSHREKIIRESHDRDFNIVKEGEKSMAAVAQVKDGQIVESASQSSLKKTKKSNGMDKDAFLQLLVAQMQNQDPLEPTSNTEYISQYAQFSQVEQLNNMAGSMTLQRASGLVGQEVIIETTTSSGNPITVQGRVDYVKYENDKAFLSVNGALYSMDDLKTVVDPIYQAAFDKAVEYVGRTNKLPSLDNLSLSDEDTVKGLNKEYEEMSDYEKSFIAEEVVKKLKKYTERINELKGTAGTDGKDTTEDGTGAEDSGETKGTGEA